MSFVVDALSRASIEKLTNDGIVLLFIAAYLYSSKKVEKYLGEGQESPKPAK